MECIIVVIISRDDDGGLPERRIDLVQVTER